MHLHLHTSRCNNDHNFQYLSPPPPLIPQSILPPPHKELGDKIRDVIRRRIISFNDGTFKYIYLITPAKCFEQACPLKDVWATNVAALACQFDYTSLVWDADRKLAVLPGKLYLNDTGPEWNGLLVEDHIATAALEMVNTFVPYKTVDSTSLPSMSVDINTPNNDCDECATTSP